MGICESSNNSAATPQNVNYPGNKDNTRDVASNINEKISFRCTYDIKDYTEQQIINCGGEEIKSKIKMLNGNQKEELIFKKKFDKIGYNIIDFIVEERLTNMSFLFFECKSLKKVEFFSFDTSEVTDMSAMFQQCNELEYLDLTNFNTFNVTDMGWMFNKCHKLKQIKGINNFNIVCQKNILTKK